jgi:hypothetical protein
MSKAKFQARSTPQYSLDDLWHKFRDWVEQNLENTRKDLALLERKNYANDGDQKHKNLWDKRFGEYEMWSDRLMTLDRIWQSLFNSSSEIRSAMGKYRGGEQRTADIGQVLLYLDKHREQEGKMAGVLRLSAEKEYERLSAVHTYEDGTEDCPILNARTVARLMERDKEDEKEREAEHDEEDHEPNHEPEDL